MLNFYLHLSTENLFFSFFGGEEKALPIPLDSNGNQTNFDEVLVQKAQDGVISKEELKELTNSYESSISDVGVSTKKYMKNLMKKMYVEILRDGYEINSESELNKLTERLKKFGVMLDVDNKFKPDNYPIDIVLYYSNGKYKLREEGWSWNDIGSDNEFSMNEVDIGRINREFSNKKKSDDYKRKLELYRREFWKVGKATIRRSYNRLKEDTSILREDINRYSEKINKGFADGLDSAIYDLGYIYRREGEDIDYRYKKNGGFEKIYIDRESKKIVMSFIGQDIDDITISFEEIYDVLYSVDRAKKGESYVKFLKNYIEKWIINSRTETL